MDKLKHQTINNKQYYLADEVRQQTESYFYGIRTTRNTAKEKNLTDDQYIIAFQNKNNEWQLYKKDDQKILNKAKLYLEVNFVKNTIFNDEEKQEKQQQTTKKRVIKKKIVKQDNQEKIQDNQEKIQDNQEKIQDNQEKIQDNQEKIQDNQEKKQVKQQQRKYRDLPNKLDLQDNEKFRDINGQIMEIDIRGIRSYDNCYFKVKDIEKCFNINRLDKILIHEITQYQEQIHYQYFVCNKVDNIDKSTNKNNEKTKKLYLTYLGLIRVLFVSRSINAEHFQIWSIKILFIHQFGDIQQKQKLAKKLGVQIDIARDVLQKSIMEVQTIYFLILGQVKDLRQKMNISQDIPDNYYICKYGKTDNLQRRLKDHQDDYGQELDIQITLKYYVYIDKKFQSQAEKDVSDYIDKNNMRFNYKNRQELCIISQQQMQPNNQNDIELSESIQKEYVNLYKKYSGQIQQIIDKIIERDNIITNLQKDIQLKDTQMELLKEQYENKLKDKEIELMKYKMQIMELQQQKNNN